MDAIISSVFSSDFIYSIFRMATPLIFASMAALITRKAGVMCIAFEGMMLFAALGGVIGSALSQNIVVGVLVGVVFGLLISMIFAYFVLVLNANSVLTGLALNTLGSGGTVFVLYVISGDKGASTSLSSLSVPSIEIPIINNIPVLGDILSNHNLLTYLAFITVVIVFILMNKSSLGLRIRSVGENPDAAESVGINVIKTRFLALMIAGVIASFGGIYMSMGYLPFFTRDMLAGRGFMAIAAQNLGGGNVVPTMLSTFLFGAAESFSNIMQSLRMPAELMQTLPYVITLIALFFVGDTTIEKPKKAQKKA